MSGKKANLETPKNTGQPPRRLGLRRMNGTTPVNHKVLPGGGLSKKTPVATQSDIRINYRCLEEQKPIPIEFSTPTATSTFTPPETASTSCRPYRLALSKKMREKLTKKRLQFHLANDLEGDIEADICRRDGRPVLAKNGSVCNANTKPSEGECVGLAEKNGSLAMCKELQVEKQHLSTYNEGSYKGEESQAEAEPLREELIADIKKARAELAAQEQHARKVQDLKEAIETWQNGFSAALHDMQQHTNPNLSLPELLERLCIPQKMLKYVND